MSELNNNTPLTDENKGDVSQSNIALTSNVEPLSKPVYILGNIGNALKKAVLWVLDLLLSMVLSIVSFGKLVGKGAVAGTVGFYKFLKRKIHQFKNNDTSGRLSFFLFGASSFKHKQYTNGVLFALFEVGYILFMALFGGNAIFMLGTLGVTAVQEVCDETGMFCQKVPKDNSIMILIYGLLSVLSIILFLYMWNRSIQSGYNNYRIDNYMKFKNIYEVNIERSNLIDEEVRNCVESGSDLKAYKNELSSKHTYDFSYIENEEDRALYERIAKEVNEYSYEYAASGYKRIKKEETLLAKKQAELEAYKAKRIQAEENVKAKGSSESVIRLYERSTEVGISKRTEVITKLTRKIFEMKKTHMPYATKQSVENANLYEKFNVYYKTNVDYTNRIRFFEHYEELVSKYDSLKDKYAEVNEANLRRKQELVVECDQKIKAINAKFDAIVERKNSLVAELKSLTNAKNAEIKAAGKNPAVVNEIEDRYFVKISKLAADLHKLPEDKAIAAMRKEEIKEVKHACDRDRKYLKTNFTSETYCVEEVINAMLLDYKFEYSFAKEMVNEIVVKEGKEVRHLTSAEVEEKLSALREALAKYNEEHQDKFVGKPKSFKEQMNGLLNENFHVSILLLPILGIILFTIVPLVFSILIAFTNYSSGHQPPNQLFTWYGFENFITLFAAPADSVYAMLPSALVKTLGWTICWTIIATFSNYFLGIILALLINKKSIKFKKLWRTIFIMTIAVPQFISLMSIGVLFKDVGAVGTWWANTFGSRLGFGTDPTNGAIVSKIIIIIVNIWIGIPYTMLSTTGILMNIPNDLYESATVDGAGPFTQFTKITLPYILFVTGSYLITQFIGNINNFNVIFFLTGGGPNISGTALQVGHTDLLITFIYKMVTSNNNPQFGIASTIGIVIFVVCAFFSIIMYNKSSSVQAEDQFQ